MKPEHIPVNFWPQVCAQDRHPQGYERRSQNQINKSRSSISEGSPFLASINKEKAIGTEGGLQLQIDSHILEMPQV